MTSRRPMTRSYSGNGRSGSQNGEDVSAPSGRSESRNYLSNVRPENRSTLCTVMAQLTEDTQPCFETTIKSKAVSESCNVKFSCVVTGNPAPELTWYKDDMELDRYCGLPKYEIFRNGKNHTLHIYNCTEEDAAIYQASARNSKGIVSCSGVLEVGTMSEYMIHQRFFAKLKQKAENKRREVEESRRRGKENIEKEQLNVINQERLLRKHRSPTGNEPLTSQGIDADEEPSVTDDKSSDITVQACVGTTEASTENGNEQLNHVYDMAEVKRSATETVGEKNICIPNGYDEAKLVQSIREDDGYQGMSLAKYLAHTVQSQGAEQHQSAPQPQEIKEADVSAVQEKERERALEKERERLKEEERERSREEERERLREVEQGRERVRQIEQEQNAASVSTAKVVSHREPEHKHKSAPQPQEIMEVDVSSVQEKERERALEKERERLKEEERERSREEERERLREVEKERERVRQIEQEQNAASVSTAKVASHNEPEHQHISALTSVFHSLKDIFFGKSKKPESTRRTSGGSVEKDIYHEISLPPSQTSPQEPETKPSVHVVGSGQDLPKLVEEPSHVVDLEIKTEPQLQTQKPATETVNTNSVKHISNVNKPEDVSQSPERHHKSVKATLSLEAQGMVRMAEEENSLEEVPEISHPSLFRATDDHTKHSSYDVPVSFNLDNPPCETAGLKSTDPLDEVMRGAEEMHILGEQRGTAAPQTDLNMADLESIKCCESQTESQLSQLADYVPLIVHMESQPVQPMDMSKKCDEKEIPHMEGECVEAEEGGFPTEINNEIDGAKEGKSLAAKENELRSSFVINKSVPSVDLVNGIQNASSSALVVNQGEISVSLLSENAMKFDLKPDEKSIPAQQTPDKKSSVAPKVCLIDKKEGGVDSDPVNDRKKEENKKDQNIASHERCSVKNKQDGVEDKMYKSVEKPSEEKRNVSTEEKKNDDKSNKNAIPDLETSPMVEISKNVRRAEVMDTQPRPFRVDRSPKLLTKAQAERRLTEKDQSAVQPIIILPDTRETVIKNVAKKRAPPQIPEIKVTLPERVKREEPVNMPRNDVLKLEPERVMQPMIKEVAQVFRGTERPVDEATKKTGESARNSARINPEPSGVNRNILSAPSGERAQDVKQQNLDARPRGGEAQGSWRGREDDNNIPTINIACADDNATTIEREPTYGQLSLPGIVISQDITQPHTLPPISVTNAKTSSKTKEDLELFVKPKSGTDHVASSEKPKENPRTQLSPDVSLSSSTKTSQSCQDTDKVSSPKDARVEPEAERLQRDKPSIEKLNLTTPVGPTLPPLSPASLRRLMAKNNPNLENQGSASAASVDGGEKKGEESGGSTPTSTLSCESSPKMKRRDSLTLIPSATPEELASGARRKIYLAKTKSEDEGSDTQGKRDSPYMSPSQARRAAFLQLQSGQQTPPTERRSPMARRKATLEVPKPKEESIEVVESAKTESKPPEKEKLDPFKAPQVIRKIRGEPFSDASGHLKLWCQFFNVLSDSTIKWYRDEEEILEMERRAGDESPLALAIVQASSRDCGVYGCSIKNEYGTDMTDYLLSADILSEFFLRDDLEVGEEIEMTPMMFTKGLADSGYWGEKFFGRIMTEEVQIGEGCVHKTCRTKVIYGLDPVFDSGSTCVTKVKNPIAFGGKEESNLTEKNLEITKQECKIQNTVREYSKIFTAEARVIENFGFSLEVIPLHLMYRPANTIPYATVEADLKGVYLKYCSMDNTGRLITRSTSEVEQKCCSFQHWIHQWTNGNLLVTRLEGVDAKITSVEIATKSKGYQGLTDKASPKIMEQFITQHQCNYYCGLLSLRPLKPLDSLQQPKIKTSKSPLLARRGIAGSSSPQLQKKGNNSPQSTRKGISSPKVTKKTSESGENSPAVKHKTVEAPKSVRMR
ncbi:microtubule-associated protein futsch isoform X2 [Triplophysa dalaica]|uniref:microtubule-associated protein futsch isoform X2 n=1 Tax=Triplophysa dalaica TaxID=1582913 RepID=UPI0024E03211|nr:microtubule-associated protein futsch isoform X2 [Triplophysa dalaica]